MVRNARIAREMAVELMKGEKQRACIIEEIDEEFDRLQIRPSWNTCSEYNDRLETHSLRASLKNPPFVLYLASNSAGLSMFL